METKDIIFQTAERLFAEQGFSGVSLRQITVAAGVNLASVNYHYYDKESLYREIMLRRLRDVNRRRLAALAEAEVRVPGVQPGIREIVHLMAQPLFTPADDPQAYNRHSLRLLGRLLSEPTPVQKELLAAEFEPAMARFGQALRRNLPGLAPAEFLWRFSFVAGALHHTLATMHDLHSLTRGICTDRDLEAALAGYVRFAESALK